MPPKKAAPKEEREPEYTEQLRTVSKHPKKMVYHTILNDMVCSHWRKNRTDRVVLQKMDILPPIRNLIKVDTPSDIKKGCTIINLYDVIEDDLSKLSSDAVLKKLQESFARCDKWIPLIVNRTVLHKIKFHSADRGFRKRTNVDIITPKFPVVVVGDVDLSSIEDFYEEEAYPEEGGRGVMIPKSPIPPKSAMLADTVNNNRRYFLYCRLDEKIFNPTEILYFNKGSAPPTLRPLASKEDIKTLIEQNNHDPSVTQSMFDKVFMPWAMKNSMAYKIEMGKK